MDIAEADRVQPSSSPQLTAIVAPMVHGADEKKDVDDEVFVPASDFLNSTCALEYLEQAGSSTNSNRIDELYRDSLYVKFDPLVCGSRKPGEAAVKREPSPSVTNNGVMVANEMSPNPTANSSDASVVKFTPCTVVKKKKPVVDVTSNVGSVPVDSSALVNLDSNDDLQLQLKLSNDRMAQMTIENGELKVDLEKMSNAHIMDVKRLRECALAIKEYEATISELKAELVKRSKKMDTSCTKTAQERDNVLEDLQSAENVVSELMKRNEKLRCTVIDMKKNESALRQTLDDLSIKLQTSERNFCHLRDSCEEQLIRTKTEMEEAIKAKDSEVVCIQAKIRKLEVLVESLEQESEQKGKQIRELSSICDELIKRAGHGNGQN